MSEKIETKIFLINGVVYSYHPIADNMIISCFSSRAIFKIVRIFRFVFSIIFLPLNFNSPLLSVSVGGFE